LVIVPVRRSILVAIIEIVIFAPIVVVDSQSEILGIVEFIVFVVVVVTIADLQRGHFLPPARSPSPSPAPVAAGGAVVVDVDVTSVHFLVDGERGWG
jgi:hypothetical protein